MVYHALCPYTGGWAPPDGVTGNTLYWWLGHLISGFRIETIAFVGGYVFCFQSVENNRRVSFCRFLWKKFRRLIIPCFLFGTIYFLLFNFNPHRFDWGVAFWKVANGVSHLWFLPMLFWCFLLGWLIDRFLQWIHPRGKLSRFLPHLLLIIFAALSLCRLHGFRLGLTRVPYFFFYFYLGYWLRMQVKRPSKPLVFSLRGVVLLAIFYLLFLLLHLQATNLQLPGVPFPCPNALRGMPVLLVRLLIMGHTLCGLLAVYGAVSYWLRRKCPLDYQPGKRLRLASNYCYGTYVFHMFFMQYLYYGTHFPAWCCGSVAGAWLMPWLSLIIVLIPSLLVTGLLLRTRWGRTLIG